MVRGVRPCPRACLVRRAPGAPRAAHDRGAALWCGAGESRQSVCCHPYAFWRREGRPETTQVCKRVAREGPRSHEPPGCGGRRLARRRGPRARSGIWPRSHISPVSASGVPSRRWLFRRLAPICSRTDARSARGDVPVAGGAQATKLLPSPWRVWARASLSGPGPTLRFAFACLVPAPILAQAFHLTLVLPRHSGAAEALKRGTAPRRPKLRRPAPGGPGDAWRPLRPAAAAGALVGSALPRPPPSARGHLSFQPCRGGPLPPFPAARAARPSLCRLLAAPGPWFRGGAALPRRRARPPATAPRQCAPAWLGSAGAGTNLSGSAAGALGAVGPCASRPVLRLPPRTEEGAGRSTG